MGVVRTARLLSLPAGAAALSVEGLARRVAGQDREQVRRDLRRRNAARTRRVLGDLKGGALKAGQLLSTVEVLFPQDPEATWRDALTGLQEANPALPFAEVEPVLVAELGPDWRSLLPGLEEQAVAAASLGQVHRATWQGRPVAVKVQYPGVREALAADVRVLSVVTRAAALVARGLAVPPIVAELRERLTEELDYRREGRAQARFAEAYADPALGVVVPAVHLATDRVLVTDWLDGTPLAEVARSGDQAERDAAAAAYQLFLVSGPERTGLLHTDPHPGNFRWLPGSRLGVLDFGSTLALPGAMPASFGGLLTALLAGDPAQVEARLREDGFVRPGATLDVGALIDLMGPFTVPSGQERFRFGREWLRGQFSREHDPRDPDYGVALSLTLPAEHLFTHRVWLSMVGVLCQLEAEVPVRPVLDRWLPGFARG